MKVYHYLSMLTLLIVGLAAAGLGEYYLMTVSFLGITPSVVAVFNMIDVSKYVVKLKSAKDEISLLEDLAISIWDNEELEDDYAEEIAAWLHGKSFQTVLRHVDSFYINPSERLEDNPNYIKYTYYPYEHELIGIVVYLDENKGGYFIVPDEMEEDMDVVLKNMAEGTEEYEEEVPATVEGEEPTKVVKTKHIHAIAMTSDILDATGFVLEHSYDESDE